MTGGVGTSERESERARERLGWLLGRARCWARRAQSRACRQAAWLGRAGGGEGKRPDRQFCFSFSKNMNRSGTCLFH
jgi:hypothetical protein